jgi:tripartite-type tricarboxylate transporter receptor subunit TctC
VIDYLTNTDTGWRDPVAGRRRALQAAAFGPAALLNATALGPFALLHAAHAAAQTATDGWPARPIKFVVPFSPGGANDLVARAAAEGVRKRLNQAVIIENRPGAGAIIGADFVAKSKPDGYTFLIGAVGVITNSLLRPQMPYADGDLVPVALIAVSPSVIVVHPSVPANDLKSFAAWTKQQDKEGANFATAGGGSTPHFVGEMLKEQTGAVLTMIPYKSGSEGVSAVIGNQVSATSEASVVVLPQIKAQRVKPIATTWERRIAAYPSIATTAEQGFPGVLIGHWAGLFAPRGTPRAIIDRLSAEIDSTARSAEMRDQFVPQGIEPAGGSQASFAAFIHRERERMGRIAKASGMTAD